jgi:hypothetical protein
LKTPCLGICTAIIIGTSPGDILAADIDLDHWEGVVACRQAIIDEKYMLIAVVSSPTNIDSGRADFVQSNKECGEALSVKSLN